MPVSSGAARAPARAGSRSAILNDFLGFEVDLIVASAFMRDVVARLGAEFELTGERIASWINDRLLLSCVEASEAET